MKKFLIILFWIVSIVATSFYTYEHPEKIEQIKYYLNKNKKPLIDLEKNDNQKVKANFFTVEFSKVISFEKSAFLIALFSGETICALRSKIFRMRSRFVKTACEAPPIVPKRRTGSNKRAIAVKKLINSPTVFVPSMI